MKMNKKKAIILGVVVLGLFGAATDKKDETEYTTPTQTQAPVEVKIATPTQTPYVISISEVKEYAAEALGCEPYDITLLDIVETGSSYTCNAVVAGTEHFISIDYNADGIIGITADNEYKFINK